MYNFLSFLSLITIAKNVYPALEKAGKQNYIITSEDGTSKSVCITISGLEENDYFTKEYKDWDGYVIVEKQNNNYTYTLWGTNKKYVLTEFYIIQYYLCILFFEKKFT